MEERDMCMRKSRGLALAAAALIVMASLGGCNTIRLINYLADGGEAESRAPQEVVSSDGRYSFTIGGRWREAAGELSDDAILEVANDRADSYVLLLTEDKLNFSEGSTPVDYALLVFNSFEESYENVEMTDTDTLQSGGMEGVTMAIQGETEGIRAKYWIDCLENDGEFVRVMGWTALGRAEDNEDSIREVMRSLRSRSDPAA